MEGCHQVILITVVLQMFLHDDDADDNTKSGSKRSKSKSTHLLFHFGMSGCFQFTEPEKIHKHAHLRFHTKVRLS